ncbi:MAG: Crp/Fnr family transcriptional regulator [Bacteroidales bacterium]
MAHSDLPFFCSMMCSSDTSKEKIEQSMCAIPHTIKTFKRGEYIAYQGDAVQQLMMLTKGRVRVEMLSYAGVSLPMEDIIAPYPLGASFLFADDNTLPVDMIAKENCQVVLISKEVFEQQISKCNVFMRGVMSFNANYMQYISERLKIFAQKGIKAKLVYYILSKEKNGEFDLGKSVALLAKHFGVERPSLSRAISEMVNDGLISFQLRKGKIINFTALEELLVKG